MSWAMRGRLKALNQRGQIVVDVGEMGLGQLALSFLAVLVGPLQVRFGEGRGLEQIEIGQGLKIEGRILGQFRHHDLGQELAHDVALERIVIEEDQRIEADV
jgi:hypothetical protein